jgi:hypothetical protein
MSEIVPILITVPLGTLSGIIGSYVTFKIVKKSMKSEIEEWLNSPKGHEAIYSIGVLLGNAIMQGTGLQKPAKGKGGLEALVVQGITALLSGKLNLGSAPAETPQF